MNDPIILPIFIVFDSLVLTTVKVIVSYHKRID
jgi:hypothetical protein